MEISILGPLEVRRHRLVTPSAPKLRRVLCLLATHANNMVSTEKLIEELWEEDPPASVTTTLQTYLYQLRKLLGLRASNGPAHGHKSSEPALLTASNGYTLFLPPDALDATRFERLAVLGQGRLRAGEVGEAAEILREALNLWRGPVLVDLAPGPVLQTEVLRLEEIRKNTLEDRIDADLQLGRHHELLGELTGLAARELTHEGFQAKLMLALYRAGRRSDALRVYQQVRKALATELGVEPSSTLWRLHQGILTSDRMLDLRTAGGNGKSRSTDAAQRPCQLPPTGRILVGRETELAAMLHALSATSNDGPAVVVATGPPGSGTSALCIRAGHEVRERYPDAQLYASMLDNGAPVDAGEVLAGFLRALGVPDRRIPPTFDARRVMFGAWAAEHQALIVLDDVVDVQQVTYLLPTSGACGVLVASRRRLFLPGSVTVVDVPPLSAEDGLRLLTEVLGADRISGSSTAVHELVMLSDGLPAILHAAASRLAGRPHWTVSRLVAQMRRADFDGDMPSEAWSPLVSGVRRTCGVMAKDLRDAFHRLCAIPAPYLPPVLVGAALGMSEEWAGFLLQELANLQLLRMECGAIPRTPVRYRFLPAIREIGLHLQSSGEERSQLPAPLVSAQARLD
ncbi:winged helix-turn-helix domain-containing protein [Nonomuraea sp. NBC_01738]|uniref:AfsR/SARP family transcriptional regulator n=1 Tax=Nonomuraea sp. NBC_01738 TaxID=2976003 RepID=UPI002E0FCDCD|nr:winged helix-turn-helix domain-containing protein [Nonomuraea sp. NBC_01738]